MKKWLNPCSQHLGVETGKTRGPDMEVVIECYISPHFFQLQPPPTPHKSLYLFIYLLLTTSTSSEEER